MNIAPQGACWSCAGYGVAGVLWSDLLATGRLLARPAARPLRATRRPAFSRRSCATVLAFGLPKVPHGLLVQVLNLADRKILDLFVTARRGRPLPDGLHASAAAVKFALSAFEPAWGPFVYAQARSAEARRARWPASPPTPSRRSLAVAPRRWPCSAASCSSCMTPHNPAFRAAAPVIPVVALAYLLHGVFLLTSIGIGIEKQARYYPMVTAAAAATNVGRELRADPALRDDGRGLGHRGSPTR